MLRPCPILFFGRAVKGKYTLRALDGDLRSLFDGKQGNFRDYSRLCHTQPCIARATATVALIRSGLCVACGGVCVTVSGYHRHSRQRAAYGGSYVRPPDRGRLPTKYPYKVDVITLLQLQGVHAPDAPAPLRGIDSQDYVRR